MDQNNSKNKVSLMDRIKGYFLPKGVQLDMLRYRPNKLSYIFGLLATVCLCIGFCIFYSGTEIVETEVEFNLFGSKNPGPWQGIDIVINILSVLSLFLASIRMEFYSRNFGIAAIVYGVFAFVRVFLLPLSLRVQGSMSASVFTWVLVFYFICGILCIVAGFLSIYRGAALRNYLKTVKPIENEKVVK